MPRSCFVINRQFQLMACAIHCILVATVLPDFASIAVGQTPGSGPEITLEMVEPLHLGAARDYSIYTDAERKNKATLRETPVSQWVNPRRANGQLGHVYVWMDGETPAAMAAIFSFPWGGVATDRRLVHELHALAPGKLYVQRNDAPNIWVPKSGLDRKAISGITDGASSLARFKIRLRQVARRFSGHCVDDKDQRWELRRLPTPLLTYPIKRPDGVNGFGAVIGMMGDVGSDLESGLLIEAVTTNSGGPAEWSFAPIRMTDMETHLSLDGQPIWESVRTETDTSFHDSNHIYFRFQDRTIPLEVNQD